MYEVGHHAPLATTSGRALVVDPSRLPVFLRYPVERVTIYAGRTWVLHRKLVVRVLAAVIIVLVAGGLLQARTGLTRVATAAVDLVSGEFASLGFGISTIDISGQALTSERAVLGALGIEASTSTLNFDAEAALLRLQALPAVASASIRKTYPDRLEIIIAEKTPVARWRIDGLTFLIDVEGAQIGDASLGDDILPLVIGDGAADDALAMVFQLGRHEMLRDGLVALSRIGDRRWDMIYDNGLRVQLPELGVAQALDRLEYFQTSAALLDRDVDRIDLRVPGSLAVQLAKHEPQEGVSGAAEQ